MVPVATCRNLEISMDTLQRTVIDGGQRGGRGPHGRPRLSFYVETSPSGRSQYTHNTKTRCCLCVSQRKVMPISTQKLLGGGPKKNSV